MTLKAILPVSLVLRYQICEKRVVWPLLILPTVFLIFLFLNLLLLSAYQLQQMHVYYLLLLHAIFHQNVCYMMIHLFISHNNISWGKKPLLPHIKPNYMPHYVILCLQFTKQLLEFHIHKSPNLIPHRSLYHALGYSI